MSVATAGILLVVASTAIEGFAQVFLKLSTGGRYGRLWLSLGIAAFVAQIMVWTGALHDLDVGIAFPMSSLCFVAVTVLSRLLLGEAIGMRKWIGVGLIVLGTGLLASPA